jgi:hypothetical protein
MDPIASLANLLTAITNLVATMAEGQTPEQRKILWDWYIQDVARWRALFHLDQEA